MVRNVAQKRAQDSRDVGLSYNRTAEILKDFLEVALHSILCLRRIYPADTFQRVKAYGVPVYQSRVPVVRKYLAGAVRSIGIELKSGNLDRLTLLIKDELTNAPIEHFIFETRYMSQKMFTNEEKKDEPLKDAPLEWETTAMFQSFLIRLFALEGQLATPDPDQAKTFSFIIKLTEGTEPDLRPTLDQNAYDEMDVDREPVQHPKEGPSPWIPALRSDLPTSQQPPTASQSIGEDGLPYTGKGKGKAGEENKQGGRGMPVRVVRSVETGIIDINLLVQEAPRMEDVGMTA